MGRGLRGLPDFIDCALHEVIRAMHRFDSVGKRDRANEKGKNPDGLAGITYPKSMARLEEEIVGEHGANANRQERKAQTSVPRRENDRWKKENKWQRIRSPAWSDCLAQ